MRQSRLSIFALILFAVLSPAVSNGQVPQQRVQVEGRVDGIFARTAGVEGGLGLTVPGGIYVRSGLIAGLGAGRHGVEGRTDFVSRFSLDPFRQSRWAPYAGGGIRAATGSELDGGSHAYFWSFSSRRPVASRQIVGVGTRG
jgi:hypothetical protein